eukprot:CAMPEP_0180436700 /NCGR_PEP_ID=MMETSP1036_2-20121128/11158_1 /TAXON_ID=632150 /ORGANISM="Azadinium spinosum, Strain 3D9" /LENGTH=32 /DNA_ID= /DNA_START= /DNA_END= /DNA_ORIENTATION=
MNMTAASSRRMLYKSTLIREVIKAATISLISS